MSDAVKTGFGQIQLAMACDHALWRVNHNLIQELMM
jgi:hypothetical protein